MFLAAIVENVYWKITSWTNITKAWTKWWLSPPPGPNNHMVAWFNNRRVGSSLLPDKISCMNTVFKNIQKLLAHKKVPEEFTQSVGVQVAKLIFLERIWEKHIHSARLIRTFEKNAETLTLKQWRHNATFSSICILLPLPIAPATQIPSHW